MVFIDFFSSVLFLLFDCVVFNRMSVLWTLWCKLWLSHWRRISSSLSAIIRIWKSASRLLRSGQKSRSGWKNVQSL